MHASHTSKPNIILPLVRLVNNSPELPIRTRFCRLTMSNLFERQADDRYEAENDPRGSENIIDDSYVEGGPIPVQRDEEPLDDPMQPPFSNTDEQLEQDEREAIDQSNILKGPRTRHAKPRTRNAYNEGPDEDDLPAEVLQGNSGRSSTR